MHRDEWSEHLARLGDAFVRRGMAAHARLLRLYWLAMRHGLLGPDGKLEVRLTREGLLEWLRTLRVPPFHAAYAVQRRGEGCRACAASGAQPTVLTDAVFPGGARMRCRTCGSVWLEDDDAPRPAA